MSEIVFVGSYEAREFPRCWRHPRDERGTYVPLLPFGYEIDGEPVPDHEMMPAPNGPLAIAAYEAISEGTPISPAFPNTPEGRLALCGWLAERHYVLGRRKVDVEAWAAILFVDAVITAEGIVLAN